MLLFEASGVYGWEGGGTTGLTVSLRFSLLDANKLECSARVIIFHLDRTGPNQLFYNLVLDLEFPTHVDSLSEVYIDCFGVSWNWGYEGNRRFTRTAFFMAVYGAMK